MKQLYIISLFIMFFIFSSCEKSEDENITDQKETPEVFQEKNLISDISSLKRGYSNLVEGLYNEIKAKSIELQELDIRIKEISEETYEKTKELNKFFSNIENYYSTARNYTENIEDSLFRVQIDSLIYKSEKNYTKEYHDLMQLRDSLKKETEKLEDKYTGLKIVLTLQSIENYQKNEMTKEYDFSDLFKKHDTLINEINNKIDN